MIPSIARYHTEHAPDDISPVTPAQQLVSDWYGSTDQCVVRIRSPITRNAAESTANPLHHIRVYEERSIVREVIWLLLGLQGAALFTQSATTTYHAFSIGVHAY